MELILFFIFLLGLGIGSFLNCIIYRLEVNQGFLKGRSYCPYCKHNLGFFDLIPVFSFVFLKGKCRYCQQKISLQYPLVELATGLLFLLIFIFQFSPKENLWLSTGQTIYNFQDLLVISYWLLITCFLIIVFVYDLKHYIIPDKVVFPVIAIAFVYNLIFDLYSNHLTIQPLSYSLFFSGLLAAFGAGLFFFLIVLISRGRWMGVGDIKLAFLMGLFLGFPEILVALFSAFLFGAIIGLGLIALKKKKLESEVPFGPFLVAGIFFAVFLGENIINWYLKFLAI